MTSSIIPLIRFEARTVNIILNNINKTYLIPLLGSRQVDSKLSSNEIIGHHNSNTTNKDFYKINQTNLKDFFNLENDDSDSLKRLSENLNKKKTQIISERAKERKLSTSKIKTFNEINHEFKHSNKKNNTSQLNNSRPITGLTGLTGLTSHQPMSREVNYSAFSAVQPSNKLDKDLSYKNQLFSGFTEREYKTKVQHKQSSIVNIGEVLHKEALVNHNGGTSNNTGSHYNMNNFLQKQGNDKKLKDEANRYA